MAGIFYDPKVHAWGSDLTRGVLTGLQMSRLAEQGKREKEEFELKKKQVAIDNAKTQLTLGMKFMELAKGNPEAQTTIANKYIVPAFKAFSSAGIVQYKPEEIDEFMGNLNFSDQTGKNLMNTILNIHKGVQKGSVNWREGLEAMDTAILGYSGELSKTQEGGLKGIRGEIVGKGVTELTKPRQVYVEGEGYKTMPQPQERITEAAMLAGKPEEAFKALKPSETKTPTSMLDFELSVYGKEVPQLRGKEDYRKKRLGWIQAQKEASPYIKALERQTETIRRREGTALRQEFNKLPEVKDFSEIRKRYDVMTSAMEESKKTKNFVAVDQALITTFNKITDPDSVVRESEYARTSSDLSLLNRLKGKVAKIQYGGPGLTQDDRNAIFRMSKQFMDVAQKKFGEREREYKAYFINYGLDPSQYLNPFGETTGEVKTAEEFLKKIGN